MALLPTLPPAPHCDVSGRTSSNGRRRHHPPSSESRPRPRASGAVPRLRPYALRPLPGIPTALAHRSVARGPPSSRPRPARTSSKTVEEHPIEAQRSLRWSSNGKTGTTGAESDVCLIATTGRDTASVPGDDVGPAVCRCCWGSDAPAYLALYAPSEHHIAKQRAYVHKCTLSIECA
ncbi:hypothetical protein DFH09DRAFT_1339753 [Mycena vulgaris]|nr:hypothetical protein DFH09DRAFT_1339753 [Mycena vulgaris]